MKNTITLFLLSGCLTAAAFNIHVHKDLSSGQYDIINDATKINFMSKRTSITCFDGSTVYLDNSAFSHLTFTASSGVASVALDQNISLSFNDGVISMNAENPTEIIVYGLNGSTLRKVSGEKSCDIRDFSAGTYIVRAIADGMVIVKKIYKPL